jgi:hypothetical protein
VLFFLIINAIFVFFFKKKEDKITPISQVSKGGSAGNLN